MEEKTNAVKYRRKNIRRWEKEERWMRGRKRRNVGEKTGRDGGRKTMEDKTKFKGVYERLYKGWEK